MKTSVRILLCCLVVASAASAQDEWKTALETLKAKIAAGSGASWDEIYSAYVAVHDHAEKVEACAEAYKEIQPDVAAALRRDSVPLGGWLMGIFGALLLWGGMIFCIGIAMKSGKSGTEPD